MCSAKSVKKRYSNGFSEEIVGETQGREGWGGEF